MARARKLRKLPTLIDRGMGLLEVILPHGGSDEDGSFLPPGQRDTGGFWFPAGFTLPGDIFTPAQRKLQAKQRQVQRHRVLSPAGPPPLVSGSRGTASVDTAPSRPHPPPEALAAELADRRLPLPAPSLEAPAALAPFDALATHRSPGGLSPGRPNLPVSSRAPLLDARGVVDSREGSD